jgi:serine/threonine-protein kinase
MQPRPGHHDPLVGTIVAGRFQIEELVGQGGMGKVYRARHLTLDKPVCLKLLKPALLEDPTLVGRFEREAKAASRLNHPNSIAVLDFGRLEERGGTLYIAMEYVQGKDLRIVLRDDWPLPEDRLARIMGQVLAALGEAHAQNVVHRDLKPENIMVEQRRAQPDFVKVLDFGIAKILDSDLPGLTRSDVVCGTPQYMAPEQATGSSLDARCDLYAVGVILYQLVTGHLPFDGSNSMEVLTKHVNELPLPPSQRTAGVSVSAALERLILRAMAKDPAERPQSALEFREELLGLYEPPPRKSNPAVERAVTAENKSVTPPPPLPTGELHTPVRVQSPARVPAAWIAAGMVALVAIFLLVAFSRRGAPIVPPPAAAAASAAAVVVPQLAAPQRDPEKAKALIAKASEWQRDGDTGAARDLLEQAVQLDPENAEAHYRLGNLFFNSQPQRARLEYEVSVRLDPKKYGDVVRSILKDL